MTRIVLVSAQIACYGVIVDAKDATAAAFNERYGFGALGGERFPRRMFLAMKTVLESMSE